MQRARTPATSTGFNTLFLPHEYRSVWTIANNYLRTFTKPASNYGEGITTPDTSRASGNPLSTIMVCIKGSRINSLSWHSYNSLPPRVMPQWDPLCFRSPNDLACRKHGPRSAGVCRYVNDTLHYRVHIESGTWRCSSTINPNII